MEFLNFVAIIRLIKLDRCQNHRVHIFGKKANPKLAKVNNLYRKHHNGKIMNRCTDLKMTLRHVLNKTKPVF